MNGGAHEVLLEVQPFGIHLNASVPPDTHSRPAVEFALEVAQIQIHRPIISRARICHVFTFEPLLNIIKYGFHRYQDRV